MPHALWPGRTSLEGIVTTAILYVVALAGTSWLLVIGTDWGILKFHILIEGVEIRKVYVRKLKQH